MTLDILTPAGHLKDDFLPAVYLDASVVIDYWVTEGMDTGPLPEEMRREPPHLGAIRELIKTDRRLVGMVDVRKALLFGDLKAHAVTSPITLLELHEWHAEAAFKNIAADAVGADVIQRMGKKNVGEILSRILQGRRREIQAGVVGRHGASTGLEILVSEGLIVPGFSQCHGLAGVLVPDIVGLSFSEKDAWGVSQILAYLQMGMADIMHLLVAKHLGCSWVATFDSDFTRCREYIHDALGLSLLTTPEELRKALTG